MNSLHHLFYSVAYKLVAKSNDWWFGFCDGTEVSVLRTVLLDVRSEHQFELRLRG